MEPSISEVAAAVAVAVRLLENLGARVDPIELPGEDLGETFRVHWYSGAANRFAAVPADLAVLCAVWAGVISSRAIITI